jgi:enamine deaminase RidA (YjgF/YER057c/UK114 family)
MEHDMPPQMHTRLHSPSTLPPALGYSHVAEVTRGKLVYIAGQVPHDPSGNLVGQDDFVAQVRQVFENLKRALASAGSSFADVIKLNYYCVDSVDPAQQPQFREVRDEYVNTAAPPASTFVVVSRLMRPGWLIEIEAIAVVRDAE